MATSIHFFVEKFDPKAGKWLNEPLETNDCTHCDDGEDHNGDDCEYCDGTAFIHVQHDYGERNPVLFRLLGFDCGTGFLSLHEKLPHKAGLPVDASEFVSQVYDQESEATYPSHMLVSDITGWHWKGGIKVNSFANAMEYLYFQTHGDLPKLRENLPMAGHSRVTAEEMHKVIHKIGDIKDGMEYVTTVSFERPWKKLIPKFVNEVIPTLQSLGDENQVRIVYWFTA